MTRLQTCFRVYLGRSVTIGIIGAILMGVSLLVVSNLVTAQIPLSTPKHGPEIDYLTTEVTKNGTVSVLVAIKSPEWDALISTELPGSKQDLINARIQTALVLSQQARNQLLQALQGYNFRIYAGMDWGFPDIALSVDAPTLNFLIASSLVAGLSRDHASTFIDANQTAQPLPPDELYF